MYTRALVKNLILPSISIGVVRAEGKDDECDNTKKLVRPRDLPLYVDPPKCVTCSNNIESEDGFLITTIRCARQELQTVLEQARLIQSEAMSAFDNVKKETSEVVSYLQQEENLLPRMGAIGVGALAGYILAARKGIIKKVLYSAAGAGAIAAVAYPQEARDYSEEVLCELKKYAVITYHFVNGADVDWKKLDEQTSCSGRIGNDLGKSLQTRPRTPDSPSSQEPNRTQPSGTTVRKNTSESQRALEDREMKPAAPREPAPRKSLRSASESCPTPSQSEATAEPLPQERPKNPQVLKRYGSYSEECKAKGACVKKRRSSPSASSADCKPKTNEELRRASEEVPHPYTKSPVDPLPCPQRPSEFVSVSSPAQISGSPVPQIPDGPTQCPRRPSKYVPPPPSPPPVRDPGSPPPHLRRPCEFYPEWAETRTQGFPPPPGLRRPSEFYPEWAQTQDHPESCPTVPSKYVPPCPSNQSPESSTLTASPDGPPPCLKRPADFLPPCPRRASDGPPPGLKRPADFLPPCPRQSSYNPPATPCPRRSVQATENNSYANQDSMGQGYSMKRQKSNCSSD